MSGNQAPIFNPAANLVNGRLLPSVQVITTAATGASMPTQYNAFFAATAVNGSSLLDWQLQYADPSTSWVSVSSGTITLAPTGGWFQTTFSGAMEANIPAASNPYIAIATTPNNPPDTGGGAFYITPASGPYFTQSTAITAFQAGTTGPSTVAVATYGTVLQSTNRPCTLLIKSL